MSWAVRLVDCLVGLNWLSLTASALTGRYDVEHELDKMVRRASTELNRTRRASSISMSGHSPLSCDASESGSDQEDTLPEPRVNGFLVGSHGGFGAAAGAGAGAAAVADDGVHAGALAANSGGNGLYYNPSDAAPQEQPGRRRRSMDSAPAQPGRQRRTSRSRSPARGVDRRSPVNKAGRVSAAAELRNEETLTRHASHHGIVLPPMEGSTHSRLPPVTIASPPSMSPRVLGQAAKDDGVPQATPTVDASFDVSLGSTGFDSTRFESYFT